MAHIMQSTSACILFILLLSTHLTWAKHSKGEEGDDDAPGGIRNPSPCEVCKYLAVELQGRLDETGKVRGFIETGHGLDVKHKKRKEYRKSELRLIEALTEPHVCDKILEYNVHAERKKSLRYSKGQSETMKTLHGLVDKGVKVELGIPYEMWDQPSAEITNMQRNCFSLVEEHEDNIESWYWGSQQQPLLDYLCRDRVLKNTDSDCLDEINAEKDSKEAASKKVRSKEETGKDSIHTTNTTPEDDHVVPISAPPTHDDVRDEL